MSSNILYVCNAMLHNVVIVSDADGKNELDSLPKFKYHQRVLNRSKNNLKNDSVLINDKIHSNSIIVVDEHGTNVLKNKDDICAKQNAEDNNLFIKVLKQIHLDKEPTNIEEFLQRKRESLQNKLKNATYYFNMKSFYKSCDLYKEVLTLIETDMYPDEFMLKDVDILAIKFSYALSKMAISKQEELQAATNILTKLTSQHGDDFPTLYYYIARCLFLLEKCQEAKKFLEIGQNVLKNMEFLEELYWPGSDTKMIVRTEKSVLDENLRSLLKECNEFHLPDLKCIYAHCQNRNIFFDSPCFNGYVIVKCTNNCKFNYHRNCWKLKLKADSIKKASYFLDSICATDDCGGIISEILIYDENKQLNSVIIPKNTTSQDKHGEKPATNNSNTTNDKLTKKSVLSKQSGNEKQQKNVCQVPTSIVEKKSNVTKESPSTCTPHVEKQKKSSPFNCNAKEYVPINKEPFKLNLNAKEYTSPKLDTHTKKDDDVRPNLFDIVDLPNRNIEPENHKLRKPYSYSEADKVSNDLVCDENSNDKLRAKTIEEYSKFTQTSLNSPINSDAKHTISKLKNELFQLQSQLFEAEEAYNMLLQQNNLLQKKFKESTTKPKICDNCTKLEDVIKQKDIENLTALVQLKQLEKSKEELTIQLNEIETKHKSQELETQQKTEHNVNLIQQNTALQEKVADLLSKLKAMSQHHAHFSRHDNTALRNVMFDQMNCIRHAYNSYFTSFENKSKHILWELEDIKTLSTSETLPTLAEVEENMTAWKTALDNCIKGRYMMNGFYDHIFRQFSNEVNVNSQMPAPLSFPSFIVEPPNIIIRHFKSIIIVNKRLEQELHQQMNAFYKMMSTPYPGLFPQTHKTPEISNGVDVDVDVEVAAAAAVDADNIAHCSVLQNNTSENIQSNHELSISDVYSNASASSSHSKWESSNVTDLKVPNMYDSMIMKTSARKISKQSMFNTDEELSNRKENIPNDATNKCDSVSVGTISKYKMQTSMETPSCSSSKQSLPNSKSKPDVIGPESLVNKLHEKLPLVPVNLISRAVNILRERSGGLTGKDSKQIITEIKQILKEIAITEKCLRKTKEIPAEKPAAWKKVNNGIHWSNEDPDVNCTICFEFMPPEQRMQLRCQHIFHKTCIKLWLHNDSVCPVCRSFATLDDEFPPLK